MGELFSNFNRDLVKNKPGSRNQEDKRLYRSEKETFGILGDLLFSGHAQRGCDLHSSVLSKLAWLLLWKRTFLEMPMQEELGQ